MVLSEWLDAGVAGVMLGGGISQRRRRQRRLRHALGFFRDFPESPRVLILSASIGGGHNAAAAVLQHDLESAGCQVAVLDGFALATPLLSRYFAWMYPTQLRYFPWLYDYQFWLSHRPAWAQIWRRLYSVMSRSALQALLKGLQPDLVISTYPLVTQALGLLRSYGVTQCPAVAVVTDYGVHRLWTAPGIDLHLVPSRVSVAQVQEATGLVRVMQPLVRPAFRARLDRQAARQSYRFGSDDFVALVVAGAWGIGRVEAIVRDVVASGVRTVVVCGRNRELYSNLMREYPYHPRVTVLGWTDELHQLMAAADCLIQNAGGLTCLEAIATGLPIVFYRPITGHGLYNALTMKEAGVAYWAQTREELWSLLQGAARGWIVLEPPRVDEEAVPAVEAILDLLPTRTAMSRAGERDLVRN